jgi:hypothetical protein
VEVDAELRRRLAVETELVELAGRQRVGQRVAARPGPAVVADHEHGVEGRIEPLDHGEGVAVVGPQQAHRPRELAGGEVPAVAVGVLHDDVGGTGGDRSLAGGGHLPVHLALELPIRRRVLAGLVPCRGPAHALDVGADEHLHDRRR